MTRWLHRTQYIKTWELLVNALSLLVLGFALGAFVVEFVL